jgi:murein DD-endopeptidase MepM/ murein hydrolase activator NlpD
MNRRARSQRYRRRTMTLFLLLAIPGLVLAAGADETADWQQFERRVRDGEIGAAEGLAEVARWAEFLEQNYPPGGFGPRVFFPLKGYGPASIGGKRGEGYRPAGYAFLGGNRHKGHPAQDIFIHDCNQDGLDDRSGRPADVLALADGVVLSTFTQWKPDDAHRHIRGGNYVWIYHPGFKMFSYYAHLHEIRVAPGEKVAGGSAIATLGRTGTNAYPPRSPTHLHLMLLRAGNMAPVDPYPLLAKSP